MSIQHDEKSIRVHGLRKEYGSFTALHGIDFEVRRGECFGLLGPNGAGKTTTLELLEGLGEASGGSAQILGTTWATGSEKLREKIGMVFQDTRFQERLTVLETLNLFRSFYKAKVPVERSLGVMDLDEFSSHRVGTLSGGQRQRLAFAVALIGDPEILILDEPTTGLDPQSRRALWRSIEELRDQGITIVLTTHYMHEAEALCDNLAIIDRGRIVARGTPAQLIAEHARDRVVHLRTEPTLADSDAATLPGVARVLPCDGFEQRLVVTDFEVFLAGIVECTQARKKLCIETLTTSSPNLEDVFLQLTGRPLAAEKFGGKGA